MTRNKRPPAPVYEAEYIEPPQRRTTPEGSTVIVLAVVVILALGIGLVWGIAKVVL